MWYFTSPSSHISQVLVGSTLQIQRKSARSLTHDDLQVHSIDPRCAHIRASLLYFQGWSGRKNVDAPASKNGIVLIISTSNKRKSLFA